MQKVQDILIRIAAATVFVAVALFAFVSPVLAQQTITSTLPGTILTMSWEGVVTTGTFHPSRGGAMTVVVASGATVVLVAAQESPQKWLKSDCDSLRAVYNEDFCRPQSCVVYDDGTEECGFTSLASTRWCERGRNSSLPVGIVCDSGNFRLYCGKCPPGTSLPKDGKK